MKRWPRWAIALGATVVVITSAVVAAGPPGEIEVSVFRWFNDPPRALGSILRLVDPLLRPVALTLLIVGVAVLLALTRRDTYRPIVVSASTAAIFAYVIDHILKYVVDRGRPAAYLEDVLLHGYPVDPLGSGFPSSHTAVVVAIVVSAWPLFDTWWRIGGAVGAVLVGLDRMYIGAHLPLDVVGGAGVGLVVGGAVVLVLRGPSPT